MRSFKRVEITASTKIVPREVLTHLNHHRHHRCRRCRLMQSGAATAAVSFSSFSWLEEEGSLRVPAGPQLRAGWWRSARTRHRQGGSAESATARKAAKTSHAAKDDDGDDGVSKTKKK